MKTTIIVSVIALLCFSINSLKAQSTSYSDSVFSNTQGIIQQEATFYEVEGYSVFTIIHNFPFNEKGFDKFRRKYQIKSDIMPKIDSTFKDGKIFLTYTPRTNKVTESGIFYLFPEGNKSMKVIGLQIIIERDLDLERFLVKSILNNSVPNYVYTSMDASNINFAGRNIILTTACHWMGTHNIQCPDMGQMNWSEFRSREKAEQMIEAQLNLIENKSIGKVLNQEGVEVIFEGSKTLALKTIYKIKIPQLILGGSNILIVYCVATMVRGKYVGCVMSHYTDDINANRLPPLLSCVMELQ